MSNYNTRANAVKPQLEQSPSILKDVSVVPSQNPNAASQSPPGFVETAEKVNNTTIEIGANKNSKYLFSIFFVKSNHQLKKFIFC